MPPMKVKKQATKDADEKDVGQAKDSAPKSRLVLLQQKQLRKRSQQMIFINSYRNCTVMIRSESRVMP